MVNPEVTSVDKEALVYSSSIGINETALDETEISMCSLLSTQKVAGSAQCGARPEVGKVDTEEA